MTRIGGNNLPTTDPLWQDQRLVDGKELTSDESKISKEQNDAMSKTSDILGRTVRSGEWDKANERVSDLKKHFESLSPDTKKYLYGVLQTKNGMSEQFHYRLSDPSIEKLLKTLNPDHKADHVKKYTLNDAQAKASKNSEKNLEGQLNRAALNQAFDNKVQDDPGFTPQVGTDKGLGDPGFNPKGVSESPIGDPGFTPKLNPDHTPISDLPIGDPGFIPKGVQDKGFDDPGFTPKLNPDHSREAQFPKDDPGFTPKGGTDQGPRDIGFIPNMTPSDSLPNDDPGFNPKLKK